MPYYKIIYWTSIRQKPFEEIRYYESIDIKEVSDIVHEEGLKKYEKLAQTQVEMLSLNAPEVLEFIKNGNR